MCIRDSEKCDLWSCGIMLFIFITGYPPQLTENQQIDYSDPLLEDIPEELKDLLYKLLTYNPEERISASEALQHPWIIDKTKHDNNNQFIKNSLSSLQKYQANQKLANAIWSYMLFQRELIGDKQQLVQAFKEIDKNGDGQLSKEEISEGYKYVLGYDLEFEEIEQILSLIHI
eukprot:TRINITY_DN16948_c0_g1_i1.p3 TRINITY_DN16948_c0_g1~~TRINITY_DN16948_c0_g1_i1.p3  ORF type:complete len:173 (+),score=31.27 TRINITY_DN16948_c0_g1_i1:115-633(+)